MAHGKTGHMLPKKEIYQNVFLISQQCMPVSGRLPAFSFFLFSGESTILLHPVRAQERLLMGTAPDRDMDLLQSPPTGPPHRHQIAIAGIVANKQREFMLAFYQQTNALIV